MSLISTLTIVYFLLGLAIVIRGIRLQSQNIKDMTADSWFVAITAGLFWLPIIIIILGIKITKSIQRRYQRRQATRLRLKRKEQSEKDAILWAEADTMMVAYMKKKAINDERKRQHDILARIPV